MIWLLPAAFATELGGVVEGPDGPVAGASVIAYDLRLQGVLAVTDAEGAWSVTVDPGSWRVRVLPPAGSSGAETWVPGATDLCAAEAFPVPGTRSLAIALPAGGRIEGALTSADGAPLANATVSAEPTAPDVAVEPRTALTDGSGAFAITGLHPATDHRIQISGDAVPTQFLPGVYLEEEAAIYAPGAGTASAGTTALRAGIAVSGAVTADGEPLASGTAQVYAPSQLRSEAIVNGAYAAAALPPGEVLVWAISAGFATTYFPDDDRPGERVFAPDEGDAVTLDLELPVESRLEGRLPGAGPFDGAAVVAYNSDRSVGVGAVVADDGSFSIGGLHGGIYTLAVYADDAGLVSGVLTDALGEVAFDLPSEATLDAGEVAVPTAAAIAGVVRDRYTEAPLYGTYVHAESRVTGAIFTTAAERDGSYALLGLAPDDYVVWADYTPACDADPDWLARWFPDNLTDALAAAQPVAAGATLSWDPSLSPDLDHDGMDDRWEADHGLDDGRDDSAEDPDGDGFTNLEEYLLGTDPLESAPRAGACGCAASPPTPTWGALAILFLWRRRCTAS